MTSADTQLIRRFIGGDPAAAADLTDRAGHSGNPAVLVAAALHGPSGNHLERAAAAAVTTRDRQLVAIAAAHLTGDHDRVRTLCRDHLADHPDHLLVAWIATLSEENS